MQDLVTYLFIGGGLIIALIACKSCFYKLHMKEKDINIVLDELKQFNEDEYTTRYEDINRIMSDNRTIGELWQEFSKTLTRYRSKESDIDLLSSPISARDIIRYSSVVEDMDIRFWQNMGSIFTGVGILGTFAGLTMGLKNVNLSSSNVSVLKDSIGNLLGGISTAFYTSLFGIGAAIIYSYFFKRYQDGVSDAVAKLAIKIE